LIVNLADDELVILDKITGTALNLFKLVPCRDSQQKTAEALDPE